MSWLVWSWNETQPDASSYATKRCGIFDHVTGRWRNEVSFPKTLHSKISKNCNVSALFACQNSSNSNDWILSDKQGSWLSQNGKCPAGYNFSVPVTPRQNEILGRLVSTGGNDVWLLLSNFNFDGTFGTAGKYQISKFIYLRSAVLRRFFRRLGRRRMRWRTGLHELQVRCWFHLWTDCFHNWTSSFHQRKQVLSHHFYGFCGQRQEF